jgi:deazaflavin-dependent oxidoreductase (nitroreductase family)
VAQKGFWGRLTTSGKPPKPGTLAFRVWKGITRANMWAYRKSGGRLLGNFDGAPLCIVHHRGAKSGQPRETPLTYLPDGERVVLIASYGGAPKSPAWYHNLKAHPDIEIERNGRREPMAAHQADAAERAELWPRIVAMYPGYDDYQKKTDRQIPVMVCVPRSG